MLSVYLEGLQTSESLPDETGKQFQFTLATSDHGWMYFEAWATRGLFRTPPGEIGSGWCPREVPSSPIWEVLKANARIVTPSCDVDLEDTSEAKQWLPPEP